MKLLYILRSITPPLIKTLVKYLYARRKLSWNTCKLVLLTHLIKWSVKIWKKVTTGTLDWLIPQWFEIWDYSYLNDRVVIYSTNEHKVKIGKFCSIANWACFIALTSHDVNCLTTNVNPDIRPSNNNRPWKSIKIWHDVRIWKNAIIMKWVTIWTWAVIWAWSIVTKNIPPYAIAVWNPAKVIKYRFDDKTIKKLLKSERRNWRIEKIKENYNLEFLY